VKQMPDASSLAAARQAMTEKQYRAANAFSIESAGD
jgi:hypothetical protein